MASFNKCILMGNLTRDPEVRFTASNLAVCKFGLAMNRKTKNGEEITTFVDVTIFDKRGESFAKFHKKGSQCLVEGELRFDMWEDKETGAKRSKHYIVAHNWEFCGSKADREESQPATATTGGGYGNGETFMGADDTPF